MRYTNPRLLYLLLLYGQSDGQLDSHSVRRTVGWTGRRTLRTVQQTGRQTVRWTVTQSDGQSD